MPTLHMDGALAGPLNTRCRIIIRTQKGTIILTTTHIALLFMILTVAHMEPDRRETG